MAARKRKARAKAKPRSKCPLGAYRANKGLGRLGARWSAGTRVARIAIGRDKGTEPQNVEGRCKLAPSRFSVRAVDRSFLRARAKQVGKQNAGATRYTTGGVYQGKQEPSLVYEVYDTGNDGDSFRKNMRSIAERLAKRFCQNEVIVEYRDETGSSRSCGYGWGKGSGDKDPFCDG